jgi:PLP dependent protein
MTTIAARLQAVNARISAAARRAGRDPGAVTLIAVSKTFPPGAIAEARAAGQHAFGENYVQECLDKIKALSDTGLQWHFLGPIQSNKTRLVAENLDWVHGVDRIKIAERLSAARPAAMPPLQVCIQVNISGEETKSGVAPEAVLPLASQIVRLPRLRLRGLMAIPEPAPDPALRRSRFRLLREIRDDLGRRGVALDTLSMGMSDDLEEAIEEGATMVRVGRAIFGARVSGNT